MAARQSHDFRHSASMYKSNLRNSEPVPEQLVQGGYRTGAGEDYLIQHTHQCRSNNSSCLPLPLSNSLDEHTVGLGNESLDAGKLNWKERIRHYTWTFFAMTMATGGIANVLYAVPYRFPGLDEIGVAFFLFNLVLFILNIALIGLRFYYHPDTLRTSFLHPAERLFVPSAVVSFGTILINISQYGISKTGPWLNSAVLVLFWLDAAMAFLASSGVYLLMWSTKAFTISNMTPIWIFPAYPLLIIGPHAAILSSRLPKEKAFGIIVGGFTLQGIGFMVTMMIYAAFIYRLMTQKLPIESTRPGMFVSVGPCGFTVAGIIGMSQNIAGALPKDFMGDAKLVSIILEVVASWASLWIWGLALWFFFVSVGAHWSCVGNERMVFNMTWYSYVFPNTALITATFAIGKAFESPQIQIIGCVMTPALILVWCFVFGMMIRAIVLKQILWPQKGEDKDETGFRCLKRIL